MSNIIKHRSVVDNTGGSHRPFSETGCDMPVIKRRALGAKNDSDISRCFPSRDACLDELNRIRVEMAGVKRELREAQSRKETLRSEIAELEAEREKLARYEGMDIDGEVVKILKQAEEDAAAIRDAAVGEAGEAAEALKSQGYLDGLEQGASEARLQVKEENRRGVEALSALLEELSGLKDGLVARHEDEIVELSLAVAEKVVGKQIREDRQAVVDMLREVLEQNRREEYIKIRMSGDLMPVQAKVSEQIREILETLCQQVDIVVESEAAPGQLIVETASGFTDLSVGTQLGNLREVLREERMPEPTKQTL